MTVCDPSYTGNSSIPDLSFYDGNPGIRAYITQGNMEDSVDGVLEQTENNRNNNFFCYGIMQEASVWLHCLLYADG